MAKRIAPPVAAIVLSIVGGIDAAIAHNWDLFVFFVLLTTKLTDGSSSTSRAANRPAD